MTKDVNDRIEMLARRALPRSKARLTGLALLTCPSVQRRERRLLLRRLPRPVGCAK